MLGVAEGRGLDVQLAPILNIDLDPTRQRLVLDAGTGDGVHLGQAVIDAGGLMGQIIEATPSHSTVLLLTDPDHAVPVMVMRNGVRLIVYGRGDHLELSDVPLNSGVEVGDVLVTSGLGGRFPAGFPVGTVAALRPDDSHAFLVGDVTPAARLDRGRDVLLLKSAPPQPLPPADPTRFLPEAAPTTQGAGAEVPAASSTTPAQPQAPAPANAPVASPSAPAQGAQSGPGGTPPATMPPQEPQR